MLRIIAGEARGRYIKSLNRDFSVRPLLGRIKKSVFDIIKDDLVGKKFLDLYAGTGSVGIEALSRGASFVVFIDIDHRCKKIIQKNINSLNWDDKVHISCSDVLKGLSWLKERFGYFDIIYCGPPYYDKDKRQLQLSEKTLEVIIDSDILALHGLIILQHHIKEKFQIPDKLKIVKERYYGDTVITFLNYK